MSNTSGGRAHNEVGVDDKGVIVSVLHGKQTAESIRALSVDIQRHMQELRSRKQKVLTLSDIRALKVSESNSGARIESRKMLSLDSDASAIVGNRGILSLTMYLARIAGGNSKIRFFTSESRARAWLNDVKHSKAKRPIIGLIAGSLFGLVGVLTLLGWQIDNIYLMQVSPEFRPVNPMAALGLIVLGYGYVGHWRNWKKQVKIAGTTSVVLGVLTLLPLNIDDLLFAQKVLATGPHAQMSGATSVCFVILGAALLMMGLKKRPWTAVQYGLCATTIGLSLFNIYGELYGREVMSGLDDILVMPFGLGVMFLVSAGVVMLLIYSRASQALSSIFRVGWLVIMLLLFVQVATYGSWSQAVARNNVDATEAFLEDSERLSSALGQRIHAYIDALHGFRGLFLASDYVDQGEFQRYHDSLGLNAAYPGIRAVSFIAKVHEKDLSSFASKHKADTSLYAGGNPAFTITNKSNLAAHYIETYSSGANVLSGVDLGSDPARHTAFERADALKGPVSSGTVQLAATPTTSAQAGFFITIPVYSQANPDVSIGFVNALFNYNDFFANTIDSKALSETLHVSITDPSDGTKVFRSSGNQSLVKSNIFSRTMQVGVADQVWKVEVAAPDSFGLSTSQTKLPRTYLVSGQLFTLLLVAMFIVQARAQQQGFRLADELTEDLAHERNAAISNDRKSSAILAGIGDAVFVIDTHRRITLFNPAAERISGYTKAEAMGKPYEEILRFELEESGQINDRFVRRALAGHASSMKNHTVLIRKDGKHVLVADSAAPVHSEKGEVQGVIIVFRDVSSEYWLDKAKDEFVSLASHQLRTPLSSINWYSEMLLNGDAGHLTKLQYEYIKEICEGNNRMIELVDALLNVSRLEVGKLTNQPEPADIGEIVKSVEKDMAATAMTKQLKIITRIQPVPPVVADPKHLRIVFSNLMSNACKYTPAGGTITIDLRQASEADINEANLSSQKQHWFFCISDTGYGIPEEARSKIFSKLYRADNIRRLDVEGTGLGLYIVKQIVENLGGRVWFTSMESVGTAFFIVAPFEYDSEK